MNQIYHVTCLCTCPVWFGACFCKELPRICCRILEKAWICWAHAETWCLGWRKPGSQWVHILLVLHLIFKICCVGWIKKVNNICWEIGWEKRIITHYRINSWRCDENADLYQLRCSLLLAYCWQILLLRVSACWLVKDSIHAVNAKVPCWIEGEHWISH